MLLTWNALRTSKESYSYNYLIFPSAHILACEPQTYFRSLLLFLQKKRQPEICLQFAGYAHPLSPFFLSIIFFHSTLSINSMFPVLYSYILIAFCLILFPRSYILILNITIIWLVYFNLQKTCLKYQFAITWLAPIIWNDIPLTVRNSLTVSKLKKSQRDYIFLSSWFSLCIICWRATEFISLKFIVKSILVSPILYTLWDLACEGQTYFRSSPLSHRRERSDDRK